LNYNKIALFKAKKEKGKKRKRRKKFEISEHLEGKKISMKMGFVLFIIDRIIFHINSISTTLFLLLLLIKPSLYYFYFWEVVTNYNNKKTGKKTNIFME